jgi:hypothetical protein
MNIVEIDGVEYVAAEDFRELEREVEILEDALGDKCTECGNLEEELEKIKDAVEALWGMV